jgi:hypothetical protein
MWVAVLRRSVQQLVIDPYLRHRLRPGLLADFIYVAVHIKRITNRSVAGPYNNGRHGFCPPVAM